MNNKKVCDYRIFIDVIKREILIENSWMKI